MSRKRTQRTEQTGLSWGVGVGGTLRRRVWESGARRGQFEGPQLRVREAGRAVCGRGVGGAGPAEHLWYQAMESGREGLRRLCF